MKDEKLIIPKGDGTLEMAIASLEIYYEYRYWLSNDLYREKLIKKHPNFEDKNTAFLLHKARTARYFGLIEYLYSNKNELKGRHGKITVEGKRFLEGYLARNEDVLIDTIMDCIHKYTFGRNNYGIEGNSNVEMPGVLLKACLDLGYVTKDESIAILYYMHDKENSYKDAIKKIFKLRENDKDSLTDVPGKWGFENRYGDNKAAQLMREIKIFEETTSQYKLTSNVKTKYSDFIKNLETKTNHSTSENVKNDKLKEQKKFDNERILDNKRLTQKIYFGPPGTGKSYNVSEEILDHQIQTELVPEEIEEYDSDYVYRTTIYPEYSYYDFIGNIMPVVDEKGTITYDFKPGIFTLALSKALNVLNNNIPVYLVIEEMSRGNIASVFGDIFQLLDRKSDGFSEYEIDNDIIVDYLIEEEIEEYNIESEEDEYIKKEIYLPPNLNILGTVNTSDQNVFVMDTAFKRRFEFEYVDTDPIKDDKTGDYLNEYHFIMNNYRYNWNDFYEKLNRYIIIDLELPEDKQIGQFFIKFDKQSDEGNYKQIQNKLLQYLWEDIHHINMTENNLFKDKFKSFSKLYKAFGEHENVFDDKFIEILYKEHIVNDSSENTEEKDRS